MLGMEHEFGNTLACECPIRAQHRRPRFPKLSVRGGLHDLLPAIAGVFRQSRQSLRGHFGGRPGNSAGVCPQSFVYRSDNRSDYNGVSFLLSHSAKWYEFTAHYTLSKATTWGAVLGELDDYVNLVSNPLNPFGPGDNGPSGEDVRSRFVLSGILHLPGKFELSTLTQLESARPFQFTTPVDVNGAGLVTNDRAVVNGVQLPLDSLRGTPYMQVDLRVARPIQISERFNIMPFIEFFNLLNRANAGANYVTNIPALTIPGTSYPLIPVQ